jgi:hypothetical protein
MALANGNGRYITAISERAIFPFGNGRCLHITAVAGLGLFDQKNAARESLIDRS